MYGSLAFHLAASLGIFLAASAIYKLVRKSTWMRSFAFGLLLSILYISVCFIAGSISSGAQPSNFCEDGVVIASAGGGAPLKCVKVSRPPPLRGLGEGSAGIPNPADAYCAGLGYSVEIVKEKGGEVGYCVFPDGSRCPSWKFFAGECGRKWSYCERFLGGEIVGSKSCSVSLKCAVCRVKLDVMRECLEWDLVRGFCRGLSSA